MDGINDAVVKQLKEQKGGDDILPLWEKIWSAYQNEGTRGLDELLGKLLQTGGNEGSAP